MLLGVRGVGAHRVWCLLRSVSCGELACTCQAILLLKSRCFLELGGQQTDMRCGVVDPSAGGLCVSTTKKCCWFCFSIVLKSIVLISFKESLSPCPHPSVSDCSLGKVTSCIIVYTAPALLLVQCRLHDPQHYLCSRLPLSSSGECTSQSTTEHMPLIVRSRC